MSVPIHCYRCGYDGIATGMMIVHSVDITIRGGSEPCPKCGGRAIYKSGTYDFVGSAISAIRAPGVTRDAAEALAGVVSAAAKGELTAQQAIDRAATLNTTLGGLIKTAYLNGITFDRMLAILSFILAAWTLCSSEMDGEKALADRRTQTVISEMILEESRKQTAASEKMIREERLQTQMLRKLEAKQNAQKPHRLRTGAPSSRAERRHEAAKQQKKLKRLKKNLSKPYRPT